MVKIKTETIAQKRFRIYNIHMPEIMNLFECYSLGRPALINNRMYVPDMFKAYFKKLKYNPETNTFELYLSMGYTITKFIFYFNVTNWKNIIDSNRYSFQMTKIEFLYSEGDKVSKFIIRENGRRYILMDSIFELLNSDGSLEETYKSQLA